jgi:hypothetical protein
MTLGTLCCFIGGGSLGYGMTHQDTPFRIVGIALIIVGFMLP